MLTPIPSIVTALEKDMNNMPGIIHEKVSIFMGSDCMRRGTKQHILFQTARIIEHETHLKLTEQLYQVPGINIKCSIMHLLRPPFVGYVAILTWITY